MNDSSKDESFYITQTSTRMEGETTEIDEHWFDIDHSSRRYTIARCKDHRKAENAVAAAVSISLKVYRLLNFTKYSSFHVRPIFTIHYKG